MACTCRRLTHFKPMIVSAQACVNSTQNILILISNSDHICVYLALKRSRFGLKLLQIYSNLFSSELKTVLTLSQAYVGPGSNLCLSPLKVYMILAQSCADLSLHFSMSQLNLYQIKIVLNLFQTRWSWLKPLSIWAQTFVYLGLNLRWSKLELILPQTCVHLGLNLCYRGSNLSCVDLGSKLIDLSSKLCSSWLKLVSILAQTCVELDSNLCWSRLKIDATVFFFIVMFRDSAKGPRKTVWNLNTSKSKKKVG